jgi:hypothetical protein
LQTMANKGHNPLIAIQMVLAGKLIWWGVKLPFKLDIIPCWNNQYISSSLSFIATSEFL